MKLFIPQIDYVIECNQEHCQSLVIENRVVWCSVLNDVVEQLQGEEGKIVLSDHDKILPMSKNIEMISQFIPFDMNQKSLLTKIMGEMQKHAVNEEHFLQTTALLTEWEKYLLDLSMEITGSINFSKINADSLVKASGMELDSSYDSLGEKLLDYFELVEVYDRKKLFILVNLRSYLSVTEMAQFVKSVIAHQYEILLVDAVDFPVLEGEQRHIVDADQCVLC